MKVEHDLHMTRGDGETSYAANSRLQEKAICKTKPVLEKAIQEVYLSLRPGNMIVVADLGCSSGPNTFLVIAEVISAISSHSKRLGYQPAEVQFFLNDLPGNDFNLIFQSFEQLEKLILQENGAALLPLYYIAGMPGSFYTRLFPAQSVHFFHSSYALMWQSKVPEELSRGTYLNESNIYIGKTTPQPVVKLYQEQYHKDFSFFLELRSKELVFNGQMMLTFFGRKNEDILRGEVSCVWELLAKALHALVLKGLVEKEKLDSFNLPYYTPSIEEVKTMIRQNGLFDINRVDIFESNWDPYDDLDDDVVLDNIQSGANIAKCIRAVAEPMLARHFGKSILNELFVIFAQNVAKHLEKEKTKYPVIVLLLKKKH